MPRNWQDIVQDPSWVHKEYEQLPEVIDPILEGMRVSGSGFSQATTGHLESFLVTFPENDQVPDFKIFLKTRDDEGDIVQREMDYEFIPKYGYYCHYLIHKPGMYTIEFLQNQTELLVQVIMATENEKYLDDLEDAVNVLMKRIALKSAENIKYQEQILNMANGAEATLVQIKNAADQWESAIEATKLASRSTAAFTKNFIEIYDTLPTFESSRPPRPDFQAPLPPEREEWVPPSISGDSVFQEEEMAELEMREVSSGESSTEESGSGDYEDYTSRGVKRKFDEEEDSYIVLEDAYIDLEENDRESLELDVGAGVPDNESPAAKSTEPEPTSRGSKRSFEEEDDVEESSGVRDNESPAHQSQDLRPLSRGSKRLFEEDDDDENYGVSGKKSSAFPLQDPGPSSRGSKRPLEEEEDAIGNNEPGSSNKKKCCTGFNDASQDSRVANDDDTNLSMENSRDAQFPGSQPELATSCEPERGEGGEPEEEGGEPEEGEGGEPEEGEGGEPEEGEGGEPEEGEGGEPEDGERDEPEDGERDEPEDGERDEPEDGERDEPEDGEGDEPEDGEGDEPEDGEGDEPEDGEGDEPEDGEGDEPEDRQDGGQQNNAAPDPNARKISEKLET